MGIVNVTPDSFSDGDQFLDPACAIAHARALAEAGATILDLGAEASSFFREGVTPTMPEEQIRRLCGVIPEIGGRAGVWISVDTRSSQVARYMLREGVSIINDISAGTHDEAMLRTVAEFGAAIILMHMGAGYPRTPEGDDADIVATVREYLRGRVEAAMAAGIPRERIAVDPGVGFGKTMADNWRLVMGCERLLELGVPVVLGASRKRFLETRVPEGVELPVERFGQNVGDHPRDGASAAVTWWAAGRGVPIHRVHHVALARIALGTPVP